MQKGLAVMAGEVQILWVNQRIEALHLLTTQGENLSPAGVNDILTRLLIACRHLAARQEDKQLYNGLLSHLAAQQTVAFDRLLRRHLDTVVPGDDKETNKQKRALLRSTRKLSPVKPFRLRKTPLSPRKPVSC